MSSENMKQYEDQNIEALSQVFTDHITKLTAIKMQEDNVPPRDVDHIAMLASAAIAGRAMAEVVMYASRADDNVDAYIKRVESMLVLIGAGIRA